jgi:hypothetical protein
MILLAIYNLDLLAWVVAMLIVPGAVCLGVTPTASHFRPYWDD